MSLWMGRSFVLELHKDHIGADLPDAGQIDHKFILFSKNPKKFAGARYDDMADTSLAQVKDHILHIAKSFPVAYIDHFFFP